MSSKAKTITATEFKAKCLRILEELGPYGLVITKHGRPIARVYPESNSDNTKLVGSMKDSIKIHGDIFSSGVRWNAESGHSHPGRPVKRRLDR